MASSGSVTMPFNSCIRGAFLVLGIRTPAILMLLLTLNNLAVFSSMKVSISSPFSSTVFPSENMTKIFKIKNDLLNKKNEKQDLQCAHSRGYLSTTTAPLVLTNSAISLPRSTTTAVTKARPLINYLKCP